MSAGGYTEHGYVLHEPGEGTRAACGVTLSMVVDVPETMRQDMATCRRCAAAERGRPTYVYRLAVKYPEGVGPDNPPKRWEPLVISGPEGDERQSFSWPTRRHYMSREGAQNRADLLTGWGCEVTIERSYPVTWPEP